MDRRPARDVSDATTRLPDARQPNALRAWPEIERRLLGRAVFLGLDYDGTLTPIVARPAEARLSAEVRSLLAELGDLGPTAILSGRLREDVERRVGLPHLYYAGSHGFDVSGPGVRLEVASEVVPVVHAAAAELGRRLAGVRGVVVEDKRFAVAVHFRQAPPGEIPRIRDAVQEVLQSRSALRWGEGKKVFELLPGVAWNKGYAFRWLQERLASPGAIPVYLGDDVTDEDALRAVQADGIGILVSTIARSGSASYHLGDPAEVRHFLTRLAALLRQPAAPPRDDT